MTQIQVDTVLIKEVQIQALKRGTTQAKLLPKIIKLGLQHLPPHKEEDDT